MKRALGLLCCVFGFGCSAASSDGAGGAGGAPASNAGTGSASGGSVTSTSTSGSGGMATGGASGASTLGGAAPSAGTTSGGVSCGSSALAGNGGVGGGGTGGVNASGGGAGGTNGCVPDPAGVLSIVGDAVHDAKTCLDWTKTTKTGVNYAAADMFCSDLMLGGVDDWRIPTASEFASIVTLCGKYLPDGPIDTKIFDEQGDGYWTSTPAGELNKVCAVGMFNAGGYYHYGTAGPQVVRCVRGTGSFKMVKDCVTAMGCKDW